MTIARRGLKVKIINQGQGEDLRVSKVEQSLAFMVTRRSDVDS